MQGMMAGMKNHGHCREVTGASMCCLKGQYPA